MYLFNDVFPRHVRVARHCPGLDDAVPMDVHLDEATFRVERYMRHKGQIIHRYLDSYMYFYLLYMIYIYAFFNFKKKPVLFNKHGAHVESACVDLAVPGYLVSKNFVGKEYVKVLHLVTLSWDVGLDVGTGWQQSDANQQSVAWGERSHIPFKGLLGKWFSSSIGGKIGTVSRRVRRFHFNHISLERIDAQRLFRLNAIVWWWKPGCFSTYF